MTDGLSLKVVATELQKAGERLSASGAGRRPRRRPPGPVDVDDRDDAGRVEGVDETSTDWRYPPRCGPAWRAAVIAEPAVLVQRSRTVLMFQDAIPATVDAISAGRVPSSP